MDEPARQRLQLIMQLADERLKLNPKDADALFAMASAQEALDDARGALKSLDRLVDFDSDYPGVWGLKAKLHSRLGQADLAQRSQVQSQERDASGGKTNGSTVPCPICENPVAIDAMTCWNCGATFAYTRSLEDELDDLGHAAILGLVEEEAHADGKPGPPPSEPTKRDKPIPKAAATLGPIMRPASGKGLTNGLVVERSPRRRAGMTNGLKGRTNGLRGRTNGRTNGLGRTNGITNGVGQTNGLTNGLGRTNGLTNGLGRTNGLTNGLGRTNGITNGLGRTNGLTNGLGRARPAGFHSSGLRAMMRNAGWKLYLIPLVSVALLLMPLFFVPEYAGPAYPIRIDGVFDDWTPFSRLDTTTGSVSNANVDIVRFGVVDNLGPFAFYVQVRGIALQGGGPAPGTMDTVRVFIDIDGTRATGYQVDGLGADRMIEISGHGGSVLSSRLWEFDSNRDVRDWNGWIKGTGTPAAASASQIEATAEWVRQASNQTAVVASVHAESWDQQDDSSDLPLSSDGGTLAILSEPQVPNVIGGTDVPLTRLTLTAYRQPVSLDSLVIQAIGTSPATAASNLRLLDGGNTLSQVVPSARDVTFTFPARQVPSGTSLVLTVVGDFTLGSGETYGVRAASDQPRPAGGGVVSVRDAPSPRVVGYLGAMPSGPRVDGGFAEWTAPVVDSANDPVPTNNPDIDIVGFGSQRVSATTYLYTDVTGRILTGTPVPEPAKPVPPSSPPAADSDRDTVPDTIDPMPFDFNNDGVPDAQTSGDYDGDGIIDYGLPGGTDYWLNTTVPSTFPAPYAGRAVSVYIGPTNRPPLLGDDVLRMFLDVDNSTFSGYAIGGVGADRLVEIRGKDGTVTQSALLAFSGSFPGEWSWTAVSPVTVALGYHAIELSVPLTATNLYVESGDFWGSTDSTSAVPALVRQLSSFDVAASTSPLSVPWAQVGPQPTTVIDPGSSAVTTNYNQQRKLVRAGDVSGQTACDATNSDGCWYTVFSDHLLEESATAAPRGPKVQNGAATLAAGDSTVNVTITSVITARSFLLLSARFNSAQPQQSQISGTLLDSTTLRFQRVVSTGAPAITIEWYLAEFLSGVSVQRGSETNPGTTVNVPLSAVDVTRSFPIVTYRSQGSTYDGNDFIKSKITNSTNLELSLQVSAGDPLSVVEWQVVSYASAKVQTGDIAFATADGSRTATFTAVPTSKAWLMFSYNSADGTAANIGQKMVRGVVTSGNTLTFDRDLTGQAMTLTWYLVEFTDDTRVQSASAAFSSGTTQVDVSITSVDSTKTIASAGAIRYNGGKTPYNADDNPGTGTVTLDLTSATNLRLTRALTGSQTADVGWFVVEFGTVTTGSLVAGIFPTDVQTSNNVYAQYRETNPSVDHTFVEVTTVQSTTSSTYVDIPGATIGSSSFTAGRKYLLVFTAQVASPLSASRSAYIQTLHGSTVFSGSEFSFRTDDTAARYGYYWFTVWTAVSGEGVKLQHHIEGTTVRVDTDQITMFKLDLGDLTENTDWSFNENTAGDTIAGTTWDGLASVTFTPSAASNWLVMTTMRGDPDSISVNYESRIARSGEATETQPLTTWEGNDATNDRYVQTLSRVFSLTAVSNTFTQESRCDAACTYPRSYSSVFALNLNKFEDSTSAWTEAPIALSTTNFATQVQTAGLTPTRAANVWILGQFADDVDTAGNFHRFRLQVDNVDQPGTQTSDAYAQWENWDTKDEVVSAIQTVGNLAVAAHTFDLDASREGTTANAEDRMIFAVSMVLANAQKLEVRYDWSGIATGSPAYSLKVEAHHTAGEDFLVQVLTPPSTWATRITITKTTDDDSVQTYTLTTAEFNAGAPSIRFVGSSDVSDPTSSDLYVDYAVVASMGQWDRIILMRSSDTSGSTWGSQIILASGRTGDSALLLARDSSEPSIAIDSAGYLHIVWVAASAAGDQSTLNLVRFTKTTVAYPTQSDLANAANWQAVTNVDDADPGFMPTVSTDTGNNPHVAWSASKTSGTVYYKNHAGGTWRSTVSWGTTFTGLSVDVSPQNDYVSLARYYEAATNEIQYTVCKDLSTSNCDASGEFTKWDGTAGADTVATAVESASYPSLATTYETNGDLWVAYAKDVDGSTRAIYARFLDYPSSGWQAAETVDSLTNTIFTKPSIGIDKNNDVHALYVATSGPQLYYKSRIGGSWGTRTAVDTASDNPTILLRAPNDATYGLDTAGLYWKTTTSETYFYYVPIPEFGEALLPIVGSVCVIILFGFRSRARKVSRARSLSPEAPTP
ncbi:MAG TPA: tetratricopeptide repeat protein [Thermoplasmata archaeon]|nr:tetratricopeptide repeat protein [Thermoplasmata archaeon]